MRIALCQNLGDPTYLLHVLTGLLVILLCVFILRARRRPLLPAVLIASIPPFLFLSVIATDISRWAVLGAFNVWVLCAASASAPCVGHDKGVALRVALAALVAPLIDPLTYPITASIYAPTPVIDRVVQELGGPRTPPFATVIERCDPGWRSVLSP